MQMFRWALMGCLIVGLVGCGSSNPTNKPTGSQSTGKPEQTAQATNKDKIVGTWEVTKSTEVPPGAIFDFTKDGKMKVSVKEDGITNEMPGTYEVEGDKLTTVGKGPDGKEDKQTDTIAKLTDAELVIKNRRGQTIELKKKK